MFLPVFAYDAGFSLSFKIASTVAFAAPKCTLRGFPPAAKMRQVEKQKCSSLFCENIRCFAHHKINTNIQIEQL